MRAKFLISFLLVLNMFDKIFIFIFILLNVYLINLNFIAQILLSYEICTYNWNNWNGRFSSMDYLLKNTNWKIYGLSRWRSPLDNIDHLLNIANKKNSNLKFIYGDLNDYSSLVDCIELSKPDYVFHLAAQSYPKTSFTEGNLTLETNIIGTYNLLNAINKSKYNPYIHVCSSSEIFGKVPKEKLHNR